MYQNAMAITFFSKRVAAFFAAMFAISALCYGVLLLLAVTYTAQRAKSEAQIQTISSELGKLERQYLLAQQQITPQKAAEMGMVTPSSSATIFADATPRMLSLQNGQ